MIVFVHLNNDLSGSPKVLSDVIKVTNELNIKNKLYVSNSSEFGFLSNSTSKISLYWYKRTAKNRFLTFLSLCISQAHLFIKLLLDKEITSDSVIYVNTLLPFGAKLYAILMRKRMICHIHEISLTPYLFYRSLVALNRHSSDLNIYVSKEHYRISGDKRIESKVLPNAVDNHFLSNGKHHPYNHKIDGKFKVTMICGAARYKGIPEFLKIAINQISNEKREITLITHYQFISTVLDKNLNILNRWYLWDNNTHPTESHKYFEVYKSLINENIRSNNIKAIYLLGQKNEISFNNIKNYFTDLCFKSKTLVEDRFSVHEIVNCKK